MRVVILGAGQVGYSIAKYLVKNDNQVTIIDNSDRVLENIANRLDVQTIQGFASHPEILAKAECKNADMLIAVTSSDEINMTACEVSGSLFNVPLKIARIRHQGYLDGEWSARKKVNNNMSIDVVISPEIEVAGSINRGLEVAGAFDVISLANDVAQIIGVRCKPHSMIVNTPLRLLGGVLPRLEMMVVCITRNGNSFFPSMDEVILPEDEVYFFIKKGEVHLAMEAFGYYPNNERRILIIGGGAIGTHLAHCVEKKDNITVTLIEKDMQRCEDAARILGKTEIIFGDALDAEILNEGLVSLSDTVVSVTNDDKVNILSSLLAKQLKANQVLTLLNNMDYAALITSLGIDAVISPRSLTVATILSHIRQGKFNSASTIADGYALVIQAKAFETSNIIGLSVEDITIPKEIIVAALIRDNEIYINPQQMIISINDYIIMVVRKDEEHKIEKLFSTRPSYL